MGDPARVAATVVSILNSSRPRARYVVGYDALLGSVWDPLLPDVVGDRVRRLFVGL